MGNIVHEVEKMKFVFLEGEKEAGHLGYTLQDGEMLVLTTFVDPEFRGGAIARKLVDHCADFAREKGYKINPVCSYVVKVFEKSDKYDDVKK